MFEDGTGRQAEFLQMLVMMEAEELTAKEMKCYVFIKCEWQLHNLVRMHPVA
jgi:hypothetical protein